MVIVDTDVAIDFLRGVEYAKSLMYGLWRNGSACLSILSVYELYAGMRKGEEEDTDNFIDGCRVMPITREIAGKAGQLYREYRKRGSTLTSIDCLINATAIVENLKIATRNKGHYPDKQILFDINFSPR